MESFNSQRLIVGISIAIVLIFALQSSTSVNQRLQYFSTKKVSSVERSNLIPCDDSHTYKTEILSLSPLMIYISHFLRDGEAEYLVALG